MLEILTAFLLTGHVANTQGVIGVQIAQDGGIIRVHTISPAFDAGLQSGDVILSCDGKKGTSEVKGDAGSYAHLTVRKTGGEITNLDVLRVPSSSVSKDTSHGQRVENHIYILGEPAPL